jgi:hypothetical protein
MRECAARDTALAGLAQVDAGRFDTTGTAEP